MKVDQCHTNTIPHQVQKNTVSNAYILWCKEIYYGPYTEVVEYLQFEELSNETDVSH